MKKIFTICISALVFSILITTEVGAETKTRNQKITFINRQLKDDFLTKIFLTNAECQKTVTSDQVKVCFKEKFLPILNDKRADRKIAVDNCKAEGSEDMTICILEKQIEQKIWCQVNEDNCDKLESERFVDAVTDLACEIQTFDNRDDYSANEIENKLKDEFDDIAEIYGFKNYELLEIIGDIRYFDRDDLENEFKEQAMKKCGFGDTGEAGDDKMGSFIGGRLAKQNSDNNEDSEKDRLIAVAADFLCVTREIIAEIQKNPDKASEYTTDKLDIILQSIIKEHGFANKEEVEKIADSYDQEELEKESLLIAKEQCGFEWENLDLPLAPEEDDAKFINVDIDDDPIRGNLDAEITIIEFSDYQCPYCGRYYTDTYSQIKSNYIDTAKVKYVFRDFPLYFYDQAMPAAIAANCVREQKGDEGYYEFHDDMFQNQAKLASDFYQETALAIGVNLDIYQSCIELSDQTEIDKDILDGQNAGVVGTPAFFILREGKETKMISGAQPYSSFEAAIEEMLK